MFEGNVVLSATFGRHVLGIGDGQVEDSSQTRVAHVVFAGEFGRFGCWDI